MNTPDERDSLLSALGDLGRASPDATRSAALIGRATRTIARRRTAAQRRMQMVASVYSRVVEPVAACALSVAFLAAVVGQAMFIAQQAHVDFLWR